MKLREGSLTAGVLQRSPGAVLRHQEGLAVVQAGAHEPHQVVVLQVLHPLQLYQQLSVHTEQMVRNKFQI